HEIDLNRFVRLGLWRHRQILGGGGGVGGRVAHRHLVVAMEQPRLEDAAVVGGTSGCTRMGATPTIARSPSRRGGRAPPSEPVRGNAPDDKKDHMGMSARSVVDVSPASAGVAEINSRTCRMLGFAG
ncbi:hypothetical protein Taro_002521, partial [Colocasia esculenta]|nr:hypothetical protein [Colocasia esculenta]